MCVVVVVGSGRASDVVAMAGFVTLLSPLPSIDDEGKSKRRPTKNVTLCKLWPGCHEIAVFKNRRKRLKHDLLQFCRIPNIEICQTLWCVHVQVMLLLPSLSFSRPGSQWLF